MAAISTFHHANAAASRNVSGDEPPCHEKARVGRAGMIKCVMLSAFSTVDLARLPPHRTEL